MPDSGMECGFTGGDLVDEIGSATLEPSKWHP
jgi:hypothetical protein